MMTPETDIGSDWNDSFTSPHFCSAAPGKLPICDPIPRRNFWATERVWKHLLICWWEATWEMFKDTFRDQYSWESRVFSCSVQHSGKGWVLKLIFHVISGQWHSCAMWINVDQCGSMWCIVGVWHVRHVPESSPRGFPLKSHWSSPMALTSHRRVARTKYLPEANSKAQSRRWWFFFYLFLMV